MSSYILEPLLNCCVKIICEIVPFLFL